MDAPTMTGRPLTDLPESALFSVTAMLPGADVASVAATSTSWSTVTDDARIWRGLTLNAYKSDFEYVDNHQFMKGLHWKEKYKQWKSVQARWRGARRGEVSLYTAKVGSQPVFCVNHIGGGAFLASGGDGTVRVMTVDVAPTAGPTADGSGASNGGGARVSMSSRAEGNAHDAGMLGMSVDMDASLACMATGEACKNVTLVTSSFAGEATAWKVNWAELSNLAHLPAKRLKSILADARLPFEGLREKDEFLARIKAWDALPLITKFARLQGHAGTIVSTANHGDIAVTGGNDGYTRVWTLGMKDRGAAGMCLAELLSPSAQHGVDSVHYDARWGTVFAGDKGGYASVWDLGGGGSLVAHLDGPGKKIGSSGRRPWVWCVKSGSTWANSCGHEPGLGRVGDDSLDYGMTLPGVGPGSGSTGRGVLNRTANVAPTWLWERVREHVAAARDGEDDDEVGSRSREGMAAGLAGVSGPAGAGAGASSVDGEVCGDGRHLLTGDTEGCVRLWDLRACGVTKARPAREHCLPASNSAAAAVSDFEGRAAVAGMVAQFSHGRFITTSFDGCARVWDLRAFRPVHTLRYSPGGGVVGRGLPGQSGADRLARVDASPDLIVSGAMDGAVVAWDMWSEGRRGQHKAE